MPSLATNFGWQFVSQLVPGLFDEGGRVVLVDDDVVPLLLEGPSNGQPVTVETRRDDEQLRHFASSLNSARTGQSRSPARVMSPSTDDRILPSHTPAAYLYYLAALAPPSVTGDEIIP